MPRRDLKPEAMFLFAPKRAKGKNREGGPGRNSRQEIDVGQIRKMLCVASGFEDSST